MAKKSTRPRQFQFAVNKPKSAKVPEPNVAQTTAPPPESLRIPPIYKPATSPEVAKARTEVLTRSLWQSWKARPPRERVIFSVVVFASTFCSWKITEYFEEHKLINQSKPAKAESAMS